MGEALYRVIEQYRSKIQPESASYIVYISKTKLRPLRFYFGQGDRSFMDMHEEGWSKTSYRPNVSWKDTYTRDIADTVLLRKHYAIGTCIVESVTIEQLLLCENEEIRLYAKQRHEFGIAEALKRCQARISDRRYGLGF